MSFQSPHLYPHAVPVLGAVVSVCLALATFASLAALALQGVGLVDWSGQ